jgi:hypothetical protein
MHYALLRTRTSTHDFDLRQALFDLDVAERQTTPLDRLCSTSTS